MKTLFTKWKKKPQFADLTSFKLMFFALPEHQWIKGYAKCHLEDFIDLLGLERLNRLWSISPFYLIPTQGPSCIVDATDGVVILLWPDLYHSINLPHDGASKAILAHGLGHLYYHHGKTHRDPLKMQIEADQFALEIGLGEELSDYLKELFQSEEIRIRQVYLTSKILSSEIEQKK